MLEKDYPQVELNEAKTQFYNPEDRCLKCPICNKVFFVRLIDNYIYKMNNIKGYRRVFCGWNCYRKAETLIKEARIKRGTRVYNKLYTDDVEVIE